MHGVGLRARRRRGPKASTYSRSTASWARSRGTSGKRAKSSSAVMRPRAARASSPGESGIFMSSPPARDYSADRGDGRRPGAAGRREAGSVLDEGLQVAAAERVPELAKRLGLDLTDPLPRDGETAAHLLQRVLALLADPEAQAEDLLLLLAERRQRLLDLGGQILTDQRVVRRARGAVLEEVAELGVLPDRRFQRERLARRLEDQPHLLRGHARMLGQLLGRRRAPHLAREVAVHPRDAVERLHHVHGDPDRPRVVRDGPRDRLADPPGGVGRELEAAAVLEPV